MAFDREIEAFIKSFVKDLDERNVAIFAGAGMSKAVGYVNWPELLSDIAEEIGLSVDKEHDLISLAQYHVNHKGSNAGLAKKILQEFSEQAEESESHRILSRLPIPTYWTTNYDALIENSLEKAFKVVDTKHSVGQLADAKPKRDVVVYKMHGDVTMPREAIISKEQYEGYFKSHEAFITALSADLISKTFLFIGFSFTDPNLDYVLSRLRLSSPIRDHYCIMKKVSRLPEDDDELFQYKTRKQELKILDLKRYRIQTLQVDDFDSVSQILAEIEHRFRKKTIFISGSAEEYGAWDRQDAQVFIHSLSKQIIASNLRIVNGFGWGVGSAVINGALEAVYGNPRKFSEDQLVIKPFPQFETSSKKLPELWEEYRQRMISLAGVAIFLFGNKLDENGKVVPAKGVWREFEIAVQRGLIPIPIALTGYMAAEILQEIEKDPAKYYGGNDAIFAAVKELSSGTFSLSNIVKKVVSILQTLSK
ncbi:MAG: SIR2 family protein [Burkholderiaceae bacterium]